MKRYFTPEELLRARYVFAFDTAGATDLVVKYAGAYYVTTVCCSGSANSVTKVKRFPIHAAFAYPHEAEMYVLNQWLVKEENEAPVECLSQFEERYPELYFARSSQPCSMKAIAKKSRAAAKRAGGDNEGCDFDSIILVCARNAAKGTRKGR